LESDDDFMTIMPSAAGCKVYGPTMARVCSRCSLSRHRSRQPARENLYIRRGLPSLSWTTSQVSQTILLVVALFTHSVCIYWNWSATFISIRCRRAWLELPSNIDTPVIMLICRVKSRRRCSRC